MMSDCGEEFRDRGTSLFRSLRPKKEKTPKQKKSGNSKSIFSSLLLANYETHMQICSYENFSTTFEDTKHCGNEGAKENQNNRIGVTLATKKIESIEQKQIDNKSESSGSDEHIMKLDKNVCEVYEDVLYNIIHHLSNEIDLESDVPVINRDSALIFVRDAFGVPQNEHDNIFEKAITREPPEIDESESSVETNAKADNERKESYYLVQLKANRWDVLVSYTCLIKVLLKHELETSQAPHYYWTGKFSFLTNTILELLSDFTYLTEIESTLTKWSAFAEIHNQHPLDLQVFEDLLEGIVEVLKNDETALQPSISINSAMVFLPACFGIKTDSNSAKHVENYMASKANQLKAKDENVVSMFWDATKTLSRSLLRFIANLKSEHITDEAKTEILQKTFILMNKLSNIEQCHKMLNFEESLKESIAIGISSQVTKRINNDKLRSKVYSEQLDELISLMERSNVDWTKDLKKFGHVFTEHFNFNYGEYLYKAYDTKLAETIKPFAIKISNLNTDVDTEVSKKLFRLYMQLKVFSDKGQELFGPCESCMKDYFNWFSGGIDKWCKASVYTALTRIQKAIELDNLKSIDSEAKHSSSAVDVSNILLSVKIFWDDLKLPSDMDVESTTSLIISDICRFAVIYFDNITARVEECEAMKNMGIFKVPLEVCVVMNSINFLKQTVQNLIVEMSANKELEDCARMQKIIANALSHGNSRVLKLYKLSLNKMTPTIRKLLLESGEVITKGSELGDRLLVYIDDSLSTLHDDLNETEFDVIKNMMWDEILQVFLDLILKSVELKRLPIFYSNLRKVLKALSELFFEDSNDPGRSNEKCAKVSLLLERHGLNTPRVIHQYYKDRYKMQQEVSKTPFHPFGVLSIQCFFFNNILKLNILNGKNLVPFGSSKKCDSFVKINFFPEDAFPEFQKCKTKVVTSTHFPLYDECFEFDLTPEQKNLKEAIIFFNIKDKVLVLSNQCLAEAFLSFGDIPEYSQRETEKQIHLTLTRLLSDDMDSLRILNVRSQAGDKTAKEFIAKIKSKIIESASKSKIPITKL